MWNLIKAEFQYFKILYLVVFGFVLILAIANSIEGNMEAYLAIILLLAFFAVSWASAQWVRQRVRFLSGLPLPARQIGIARYGAFAVLWFVFAIFLSLSSFIGQQGRLGPDYVCWMLTKIGSMCIFAGGVGLATDIYYCSKSKGSARFLTWFAAMILMLAGFVIGLSLYLLTIPGPGVWSRPFQIYLTELFLTLPGSLGSLVFGFALIGLDVYVYGRRRSYIEDYSVWVSRP